MHYYRPPRDWENKTAVIFASGPSRRVQEVEAVRLARQEQPDKFRVIAINKEYLFIPFADIHYFCDSQFILWHAAKPEFAKHPAQKITVASGLRIDAMPAYINLMRLGDAYGLAKDSDTLNHGSNSGYQAMNLAYHKGAARIILIGFDMKRDQDGRRHHHSGHPVDAPPELYNDILKAGYFESLATDLYAAGVEVINCTPDSAMHCFTRFPLDDALRL